MLTALSDLVGSRPRRSLFVLLAFVVVAAALGGPVAGALQEDGGFLPPDSGSVRAIERIQAASGTQAGAGLVLLVDTPAGAGSRAGRARVASLRAELLKAPGVASVATAQSTRDPAFVSRDGRATFLAVTLAAGADEPAIADAVVERLEDEDDVTVAVF